MCPDVRSQKDSIEGSAHVPFRLISCRVPSASQGKAVPSGGTSALSLPVLNWIQLNFSIMGHVYCCWWQGELETLGSCIIQRGTDKGLFFNNMIKRGPKMGILCKSTADLAKSICQIWKGKILTGTKFTKIPAPKPKSFKYVTQFFPE